MNRMRGGSIFHEPHLPHISGYLAVCFKFRIYMSGRGSNETKVVRFFALNFHSGDAELSAGLASIGASIEGSENNPGSCRMEGNTGN